MQYETPASLPQVDKLSAQHSRNVARHVRQKIVAADGLISFAEYMHEVLYAPGLGYYSSGSTKLGAAGDFTTAPEVSPVFGRVVARQLAEALGQIGNGEILEFGAGSGRLAVDVLHTLEAINALPTAYNILEVSPDLQLRQRQLISDEAPHLVDRVHWLSQLPMHFDGVIIANEVMDALPVERFRKRASGIEQLCVGVDGDALVWRERPAATNLCESVAAIEDELREVLADGYVSELSLALPAWIAEISQSLRHGVVFLIDYGVSQREFYAVDRAEGWLRCHFRHHAHNDPLILPGIQDLTTWVNFSAIAAAAVEHELDLLGYQTQSQFLLGGGLQEIMLEFQDLDVAQQMRLSGQIKTLTLPGEMGENFKCLALGRGDINAPSAFDFADRMKTL